MMDVNTKLSEFLEKNKGIIIKIARKKLGPYFNEKEALSIAYLAGLQAKVYKRDQFQKTKDTTVFVWYFKKGLESIRGLDGGEYINKSNKLTDNQDSRSVDFEQAVFPAENDDTDLYCRRLYNNLHGIEPLTESKKDFRVSIRSFKDKAVSKKLLDTLRLLTHQHNLSSSAITELGKMYGCKRKSTLTSKILEELIGEVRTMGLKLFKAECLNDTQSIVIACAKTKEEAYSYFTEYGKVVRCSQLIVS